MELYDDVHAAVNDFSGFQRRWSKVREGFAEFFGDFKPETLQISGVSVELDGLAGTCVIDAFGRKFATTLTPLMLSNKALVGNVEFVEVVKEKRILIERFLITPQQEITTLAGETLMPVSNYSSEQTRYILNLLLLGLSRPVTSTED